VEPVFRLGTDEQRARVVRVEPEHPGGNLQSLGIEASLVKALDQDSLVGQKAVGLMRGCLDDSA
jgi:hypothetical protein